MLWGLHYPKKRKISATAQASTFSTITPLSYNSVASVSTQSLNQNSLKEQGTLHHHLMENHHQQSSHLQEILRHTTTHPKRYHTYQLNPIHTQVHHISVRRTYMTHLSPDIINEDDVRVRNLKKA